MLEQIKFINHINEEIDFGQNGIYVNYNDLHDYSWAFTSDNNRISSFRKGIINKSIPLIIKATSAAEGLQIKNKLMEIGEKDVLAVQHGRIFVGDYYLKCFISGSKKRNYLINKEYLEATITITTDYPQWVKESTMSFRTDGSVVSDGSGTSTSSGSHNFDYNYDFPYDYTSRLKDKGLNNTGFVGTNFKLIIFGPVTNPTVFISDHTYQVKTPVLDGEYLTINSLEKTIYLTQHDGTMVNCFNQRNRDAYIFEKIPPGINTVTWNNAFRFDVTLLEERSEPKWT